MLQKKDVSVLSLALLLALVTAPKLQAGFLALDPAFAQSPSASPFKLPDVVPKDSKVRVNGSNSLTKINQILKQRFEEKFSGTTVELPSRYLGSAQALQALSDDKIELAALGRPLTDAEKAQGLEQVVIARHKIAMIVSANNPFQGSLTDKQFAQIFRGEITDWSQVGGKPGKIRFIDRPETSDTRQAFQSYPVFKRATFATGANTVKVAEDTTEAVIQALGTDGISYAIADQVFQVSGSQARVLQMHKTLPNNPAYPFSQPLVYVYKKAATLPPALQAFLAYATAPENQAAIETARKADATTPAAIAQAPVPPTPSTSPSAKATSTIPPIADASLSAKSPDGAVTITGSKDGTLQYLDTAGKPIGAAFKLGVPIAALAFSPDSKTIVAGGADGTLQYFDLDGKPLGAAFTLGAPLSAVAFAADGKSINATGQDNRVASFDLNGHPLASKAGLPWWWWLLPLALLALLLGWWLKSRQKPDLAQPGLSGVGSLVPPMPPAEEPTVAPVPITPIAPEASKAPSTADAIGAIDAAGAAGTALAGGAIAATAAAIGIAGAGRKSTITLTPRDSHLAYAEWDTPNDHKAEVISQGGSNLALKIYDVTDIDLNTTPAHNVETFDVEESAWNRTVPIPASDRDYLAEIGYATPDGRWLALARSEHIRVASALTTEQADTVDADSTPAMPSLTPPSLGEMATVAAIAGTAAVTAFSGKNDDQSSVEATKFDVGQTNLTSESLASVDAGLADLPSGYGESRITLLPRDPRWAYAYWDVPNEHREELRRQGGQRLALRIYDVTDIEIAQQAPHSLQEYDCDELARDWYLPMPVSDRDYIAEIGYLTPEGRWLMLARSNPIRIPPVYPSDWFDDQFVTLSWDEELRGKTFMTLVPPAQRPTGDSPIYDRIFGMAESAEAQRVAGSLFGSMHQVPGSAQMIPSISSFVFPSGVGMGAVPTFSGLTMSGINMSGVGFSASFPSIRARKFWLVADSELIIYGATEPDATVTIAGQPIRLNPDGTFRFQMSFQDGLLDFPIMAVAVDGEQTREIHMKFTRETPRRRTNTKDEASEEAF
ncbi:MAG: DUF4912 domain-containing protein [Scytolyngbya sp. HA4215-MV1]|jgi:hypothetical protein|nr:DUF4912 domain-containing protein [Scytolyngbya sp. HA4215-MV1]